MHPSPIQYPVASQPHELIAYRLSNACSLCYSIMTVKYPVPHRWSRYSLGFFLSDNGLLENANTTCYQDAKSDQSDDDLVSLSSAESESSHFSDNNEIDQTTQPHPPSVATENTEHPSVATETTEHTQTDNCSVSSDGWFKVEANVTETTPTQPLPMVGQSNSQGTESCASSAKTVEVLSSSVQDPSSFTSLEDTETETGSIVSASPLPQTEDAATSLSSIEELRRNQQQGVHTCMYCTVCEVCHNHNLLYMHLFHLCYIVNLLIVSHPCPLYPWIIPIFIYLTMSEIIVCVVVHSEDNPCEYSNFVY